MKPTARLDDVSGKEWLSATHSVLISGVDNAYDALSWERLNAGSVTVMSAPVARSRGKKLHPATFLEGDPRNLMCLFTREGERVLDPFLGSGSTAIACVAERRYCIGFELYEKWADLAMERASDSADIAKPSQTNAA